MTDWSNILIALALTLGAGLATGLGGLLSMFSKSNNDKLLAFAMGLSGGVMVYISFTEMLPDSIESFESIANAQMSQIWTILSFFAGVALIGIIDWLVPEDENPHGAHTMGELREKENHHLKRTGGMLALAIGIHNFPEGIATFVSALDGVEFALPIVIAVAIHNIPEGVAVFVPLYYSTGSRRKALVYTFLSGLSEPLGAVVAALFLLPFWTPVVNAVCLAAVAGIMVYISFDELLPGAESHGHHHTALIGIFTGIALMSLSLIWV